MNTKELEERLTDLEDGTFLAGTALSRVLDTVTDPKKSKLRWTLGIGGLGQPKKWFTDDTIEGVLTQAETHVRERIRKT